MNSTSCQEGSFFVFGNGRYGVTVDRVHDWLWAYAPDRWHVAGGRAFDAPLGHPPRPRRRRPRDHLRTAPRPPDLSPQTHRGLRRRQRRGQLRQGARGSSARTGTFLRVYDQHLPAHAGAAGVRAEIEVSRPGYLAAVEQIKNPFGKFGMYQFSPEVNRSLFACFVSAARERGVKRAMALISDDQQRATEFLAILDQSHASWWDPDPLWESAKQSTAGIFINHAADKGLSLTGLAA